MVVFCPSKMVRPELTAKPVTGCTCAPQPEIISSFVAEGVIEPVLRD